MHKVHASLTARSALRTQFRVGTPANGIYQNVNTIEKTLFMNDDASLMANDGFISIYRTTN